MGTPTAQFLQTYLSQITDFKRNLGLGIPPGFNYLGGEDYVLDRGSSYPSAPLTPAEKAFVMKAISECPVKRWKLGHCYYNAQLLSASDSTRQIRYVEGWAVGLAMLPVLHGWATLNGKVIDLTWRTRHKTRAKLSDRIFGAIPDGWAYHGVEFDTESVIARLKRLKVAGPFLDDVANGFPLFQEPRIRERSHV